MSVIGRSGVTSELNVSLEPIANAAVPGSVFVIPLGYVGWVRITGGVRSAGAPSSSTGGRVYKVDIKGNLSISTELPPPQSERHYRYYLPDGSTEDLVNDYRSGRGMVWGERYGVTSGEVNSLYFFIGTEEQYKAQGLKGLMR